jgi:hypothetical protein
MKRPHFHWQNLNDRPGDTWRSGSTGNPIRHGRAWLSFGEWLTFGWSWSLKDTFCHIKFGVDGDEGELDWSIAIPYLALWFHLGGTAMRWPIKLFGCDYESNSSKNGGDIYGMERDTGISIHDWGIWVDVWRKRMCWSRDDPWWMHWSVDLKDLFLGRAKYAREVLEKRAVKIPMPEATYDATVEFTRDSWKRSRWPWPLVITRVNFDVPDGIPIPGKGENSWDCGPDATGGLTAPASSIEEGIGMVISSALNTRKRRGVKPDYAERA